MNLSPSYGRRGIIGDIFLSLLLLTSKYKIMTVSAFFGIVLKMILYPLAFYWAVKYYFFNEKNLEFSELWNESNIFICSFVVSIIFLFVMVVCLMAYIIYNRNKALTIVFSPKYIRERYWKDVNKAFDGN